MAVNRTPVLSPPAMCVYLTVEAVLGVCQGGRRWFLVVVVVRDMSRTRMGGLQLTCTFFFFNIKQRKTETRKTARVLKQDPNTEKVKKKPYLI